MSVRFRQLWRSCAERKGKCDSRLFGGDGFAWHWAFANDASTERTEQRFSVRRDSFRRGRARGTPREKIRANLSTRFHPKLLFFATRMVAATQNRHSCPLPFAISAAII